MSSTESTDVKPPASGINKTLWVLLVLVVAALAYAFGSSVWLGIGGFVLGHGTSALACETAWECSWRTVLGLPAIILYPVSLACIVMAVSGETSGEDDPGERAFVLARIALLASAARAAGDLLVVGVA